MMRIKEVVVNHIKKISPYYVPEWVFDENGGDLGSAFALTFADMFSDTLKRYDKLFYKNYIEFLNSTGIKPLGRQAANGHVVFYLAQGAPTGSYVNEDTALYDDNGEIVYITERPIYVTPAQIESIFYTSYAADEIVMWKDNMLYNQQKHELYISHGWAFNSGGNTEITICFNEADTGVLHGSDVQWSYFAGEWEQFASVNCDADKVILKIDANKPFIQVELFGQSSLYICCRALNIDRLAEFSTEGVNINVSSACAEPFKIYHGDIQLDNASAYPFGKSLSIYDDFFIECREAFGKKGALIEIEFEIISYRQELINYMPEPPVQWKHVIPKSKFKEPETYDIEIREVLIDYWNGMDFVKLVINENISDIFYPSGSLLQKKISFICPDDMEMTVINGCESMWIRIRTLEISNLYKNNTHNVVPCIKNINIAYKYLNSLRPVIHTENNITVEEFFAGKPFKQMEHFSTCIFFGLSSPPDGSPIGLLFDIEPDLYALPKEISWYSSCSNGWNRLITSDHTENLKKSGVITLYIDEQLEKRSIFNRELYWIKAEYNTECIIRNIFNKVYINAAAVVQKTPMIEENLQIAHKDKLVELKLDLSRITDLEVCGGGDELSYKLNHQENSIIFDTSKVDRLNAVPDVKVRYRLSDGDKGNLPADSITKMHMSLGYISKVNNPLPVTGGRDAETFEHILLRGADRLTHRDRAVTAGDFEALAYKSTGNILKCKCMADRGIITIVYLPDDYEIDKRAVSYTADKIIDYISARTSPFLKITAIEPEYIEIRVNARIKIKSGSVIKAKDEIEARLTAFLNPVKGNFRGNGFDIGFVPDGNYIMSFLKSLGDVDYIESFSVSAYRKLRDNRQEIDFNRIPDTGHAMAVSGQHSIICRP